MEEHWCKFFNKIFGCKIILKQLTFMILFECTKYFLFHLQHIQSMFFCNKNISIKTVKNHKFSIFFKPGITVSYKKFILYVFNPRKLQFLEFSVIFQKMQNLLYFFWFSQFKCFPPKKSLKMIFCKSILKI